MTSKYVNTGLLTGPADSPKSAWILEKVSEATGSKTQGNVEGQRQQADKAGGDGTAVSVSV